jgi:hypothetical protein
VARPLGVKDQVVVVAGRIRAGKVPGIGVFLVGGVCDFLGRPFLPVVGVEEAEIVRRRLVGQFVVDVVEEVLDRHVALVPQHYRGSGAEWHGEVAVHGRRERSFGSAAGSEDRAERQGYVVDGGGVADAEEVAERGADAGRR